jgi:hypothetical protein
MAKKRFKHIMPHNCVLGKFWWKASVLMQLRLKGEKSQRARTQSQK